MNIRNKYGITFLSVFLAISLALPYCCHVDISQLLSHHQEASMHASHSQSQDDADCKCGHELVKDFQKNKKAVSNINPTGFTAFTIVEGLDAFRRSYSGLTIERLLFRAIPGPSLYLMNSVFLN